MRRLRTAAMIAVFFSVMAASAAAQSSDADAGPVSVRVRVLRPPQGSMRRGVLPAAEWAVYAGGGALVLCAAGWLVWRAIRSK
jgi:hypothetical protein